MFVPVGKAQKINGEPQAQEGERKGRGSAAGRRSQIVSYLKSQGRREKMDMMQGPDL